MGWANCGQDSEGRPIGYAHDAVCDEPGCNTKIHRGLAYACGGMHGETEYGCEKYFCAKHLRVVETIDGDVLGICRECEKLAEEYDQLVDD